MPFWPKMPFLSESKRFLPDMAICKEVAFRPEMAMNQNWTNQLHFGQNGFLDRFFFARNVFLPEIAVQQKMPFGQKYSFQIWSGVLARSDFLSRNVSLTNLIKKANFSKYWKVWLAFDGWKLSGLLLTKFTRQIIGVRKKNTFLREFGFSIVRILIPRQVENYSEMCSTTWTFVIIEPQIRK